MSKPKRIACLANSRKLTGRCVAGREFVDGLPGAWVRPVSDREHEEVSEYERQYQDGKDPRVLDIIDVPLVGRRPVAYQTENWLLDPGYYWAKVGRVTSAQLDGLLDPVASLWVNGHSTYHGTNDRIPLGNAESLASSLVLIRVPKIRLSVFAPGAAFGDHKRRVRARFEHAGVTYGLRVTDPDYERRYLAKEDGSYDLGPSYVTVSLGEQFQGYVYKLVAAIIKAPVS